MPTVEERLARTEAAIASLRERNEALAQENRWLKDQIFGRSSEKRTAPVVGNQPYLFNEAEALGETTAEERVQVPAHSRAKRGRKPIKDTLPRVEIVHDLADDEKVCPHDGTPLVKVGEEPSEQTDYVPATLRVLRHIRYKYGCPCCKGFMKTAAKPEQILPKSNATPSLLAQVTTAKYVDGMPLYRQQAQFARLGLELPRATMANWIVKLGTVSVI
ncbi:MAG: IS66 family transposase zinc-finger binding domain-containing protein, partial [Alphaproteobacteria bacterium]|nr:IS66 family transposase zinc-finger binding domain-containing protein [Alphaproteobacteria bacterium]